jgi:hypothetical protein
MADLKKTEEQTKIRLKEDGDFGYDLTRVKAGIFDTYLRQITNLKPLSNPNNSKNSWEEDEAQQSLSQKKALKNKRQIKNGCFKSIKPF